MRITSLTLACGIIFALGMSGVATQDKGEQEPSARQRLQQIHSSRSMDEELTHLTKDLELSPEQEQQVRALLQKHHDRIQAPLD